MGSTRYRRFLKLGHQPLWLALVLLTLLLACSSHRGVRSGTSRPNPPPATGDIAPELAELKRDLGLLAQLDSRNDKRNKRNNRHSDKHSDKRSDEREADEGDDEDDGGADESADAVSICIQIICLAAQDENERRRRKRRNRRRRRRLSGK